jgi:peptide/nickel transport system substrate-binding protein
VLASTSQAVSSKPTLTFALAFGPSNLDPAKDAGGPPQTMRSLTNQPLIHVRPNGDLVSGLAKSWRYINSKTFQITLQSGFRFSDGSPVTAGAVRSWLQYFLKAKGPWVASLGEVSSISTTGTSVVTIHTSQPNPALPVALSDFYPGGSVTGPKGLATPKTLGTQTDGAGPYVVDPKASVSGDHYTLVPNQYYPNKSAQRWSKVVVRVIAKPSTMLAAAKTGQIAVGFGDATTADAAQKAGLRVISAQTGTEGIVLTDRAGKVVPALGDVRVRQALNYALNRKQITQALVGKWGTPTSEILSIDGWDPKYQNYYKYDPAKAKQLLAAAGYPNGFEFTATIPSFVGVLGDPLAQAIAQDLKAIGVTLKLNSTTTNNQFVTGALGQKYSGFQATQGAFPMWLAYKNEFAPTGAAINPFGASDATLNKLFAAGSAAKDPTPIWRQMAARMTTQAMWLPVFGVKWMYYISSKIGGVAVSAKSLQPYAADWYPKK